MNKKGLSICIPVYNCDIRDLTKELQYQGEQLDIPFEILAYEDGSTEKIDLNKEISSLSNVTHCILTKNKGRSAIRNYLASQAEYNKLLFLDCDSRIINKNFLGTYFKGIIAPVVIGGRIYSDRSPGKKYVLHWKYGKEREVQPAEVRQKRPYLSLMLNNILIEKDLFMDLKLDENIEGYGHEDTLLGFQLKRSSVPVQHIDNPVLHNELETNEEFLDKSQQAIKNLIYLIKGGYAGDVKLYNYYLKFRKTGLLSLISRLQNNFRKRLLSSSDPNLKLLDMWKLSILNKELNN